jgi:hypothetical protein
MILHEKGARSPSLSDTLKVDNVAFDLTGSTVKFKMRLESSATLKVDTAATIVAPTAGTVRYDWAAIDVDTGGDYLGWWEVTLPGGKLQDTPRFSIRVLDLVTPDLSSRALVSLWETQDWLNGQNVNAELQEIVRAINDISARFHDEARREFKVNGTNPLTRTFPVTRRGITQPFYVDGQFMGDTLLYNRQLPVGDMAAAPTTVQILNTDWTSVLETVSAANITVHRDERDPIAGPIRYLEFQTTVTSLAEGMRVAVTGNFGFPSVPGSVRQAVLDAVVETLDRDVEHPRQDMSPVSSSESANVIVLGRTPQAVSLPPRALAVARYWRDPVVG